MKKSMAKKDEPKKEDVIFEKKYIIYEVDDKASKGASDFITIQNETIDLEGLLDNNYYKVCNYSLFSEYYISFCEKTNITDIEIVGIIVVPKNSLHRFFCCNISNDKNIIEIIYKFSNDTYIMYASLDDEYVTKIIDMSSLIKNINDNSKLSIQLLDILNYEKHFYLSQINGETIKTKSVSFHSSQDEQLRNGYCNGAQTVTYQQFDNYTSFKGALRAFLRSETARNSVKMYKNGYSNTYQATDTMIADVIPKQLFANEGIYSYIGTEYGFFVKTVSIVGGDYTSDFIIFNIKQQKMTSCANGYGKFELKVVFKGIVSYYSSLNVLSEVYPGSKLAIGNINVNLAVRNKNEPNIGDYNYDSYSDAGFYISYYNIVYNGKIHIETNFNGRYLRYAASALGLIPYAGTFLKWTANAAISGVEYLYNSNLQPLPELLHDNDENYHVETNWASTAMSQDDMITSYGNLVKGINSSIVNSDGTVNSTNPLLLNCNNSNRVFIRYSLGKFSTSPTLDSLFETRISLDIFEDNTYVDIFDVTHINVVFQDSVNNAWAEEFNCNRASSTRTINADKVVEVEYKYNGYQDFNFTPKFSGWYDIETFGTRYDTVLGLYNGNSLIKVDNNSGRYVFEQNEYYSDEIVPDEYEIEPLCSLMHCNLTANTTYTIRVKGASNKAGYTNLIVKRHGDDLMELTTPSNYTTFSGYSQWQKFVPSRSDIYDILTFNHNDIVNTYIELYDRNHNKIKYCDNYDNTLHGKVSFYLEEGEIYFVKTWHSGADTSQRQFGVAAIKEEEVDSMNSNMYYESINKIEKGTNDVILYRFYPKYNSTYSFYTEYVSGVKNLVMYLFDSDFNQLSYSDNDNGDQQPLINYQCYNYKTYFVMIKQYSASNGDYTWFNFVVED